MSHNHAITLAALTVAAATLPVLAHAGSEGGSNPQQEARIERLIEEAIQGNSEADRQDQARLDRLVRQALQRATSSGRTDQAGHANILAEGRSAASRQ
jgi:hypothetical protein